MKEKLATEGNGTASLQTQVSLLEASLSLSPSLCLLSPLITGMSYMGQCPRPCHLPPLLAAVGEKRREQRDSVRKKAQS